MTDWKPVGTVEILKLRIYALDPGNDSPMRGEVAVEPGVFPLLRNCDAYRWVMKGRMNERIEKIGDGLFALYDGDRPVGPEVEFSSPIFGGEEFANLLTEPICQPGPDQRLIFTIEVDS